MWKRLFDIVFSLVALGLLALPMLAIAVCIKVDSSGPILFRQCRVGLRGKSFTILKFRTMNQHAERGGLQLTIASDSRITRMGRVLRKYKLDELPQFLNVVVGDMSVVGPRPEVPKYVAMYPESIRAMVLSIRPGITDLASIKYRDENELLGRSAEPERTYVEQILPTKLELGRRYVLERSFLGDLVIIGRSLRSSFISNCHK